MRMKMQTTVFKSRVNAALGGLSVLAKGAVLALVSALIVSGCGGGSSSETPAVPAEPIVVTVGPGEFKGVTLLKTFSAADLARAAADPSSALPSVTPRYGVKAYRLEYLTLDGDGKQVLASALVNVPEKTNGASSPVMALQHGTITRDAEAPTRVVAPTEASVAFASLGYVVLAPDYVGYGSSRGVPHPYLLSAPSASVVVDLLTAAKYWRQTTNQRDNGQLFFAGYSEGAYVSVAAARSMATGSSPHGKNLAMVVTGGGPYQVLVTLDEILKKIRSENAVLGALVNPGFLKFLSDGVRASVRNALLGELLGGGADVTFHPAVIDNYLSDNTQAIEAQSNVHDWKPVVAMRLFHGKDDQTVTYKSSSATIQAMGAKGASDLLSLKDCSRQPAGHLECVQPFWQFVVNQLTPVARDL